MNDRYWVKRVVDEDGERIIPLTKQEEGRLAEIITMNLNNHEQEVMGMYNLVIQGKTEEAKQWMVNLNREIVSTTTKMMAAERGVEDIICI